MKCLQTGVLILAAACVGTCPVLFPPIAYADTTWVAQGEVSGHWTLAGSPYMINDGTIGIRQDSTLTIDPGVTVFFNGPYMLVVWGSLFAYGTAQDSIYFTAPPADTMEQAWRGIYFEVVEFDTNVSVLRYCVFEHANGPGALGGTGGAVQVLGSAVWCQHCSFRHNRAVPMRDGRDMSRHGGAIYLNQTNARFDTCEIVENNCGRLGLGGAIFCVGGEWNPMFRSCLMQYDTAASGGALAIRNRAPFAFPWFGTCTISNNVAFYNGGGVHLDSSNAYFDRCSIVNNSSGQCGGGLFATHGTTARISWSDLAGNQSFWGGAVFCTWNSHTLLDYCVMYSNIAGLGSAIYSWQAQPVISHCTISDNVNTQPGGGAVFLNESNATLTNTIVAWSYAAYGIYFLRSPESQVNYCDIGINSAGDLGFYSDPQEDAPPDVGQLSQTNAKGDSCDPYHNIFLDPEFVDAQNVNYNLVWNSPCIDAGDPAAHDPDGTVADIGAFYRDIAAADPEQTAVCIYQLAQNYPNPFNSTTRIAFDLPTAVNGELAVYDLTGRLVTTLLSGQLAAGQHHVNWDAANLPSGVYICRLRAGQHVQTQKMILLK